MSGGAGCRQQDNVGCRPSFKQWWAALLVMATVATANPAAAGHSAVDGQYQFAIPTQPLADALRRYSDLTGIELYYESKLVEGRQSAPLKGTLSPFKALEALLEGTGLDIRVLEPGTATLLPPKVSQKRELSAIKAQTEEFTPYLALVQGSIRALFCSFEGTEQNVEEILLRIWLSPSGGVERATIRLPASTGAHQEAYSEAVRRLVIPEPPPQGMPQPVTLLVLPRISREAAECTDPGRWRTTDE